jgi:hypothetical protein
MNPSADDQLTNITEPSVFYNEYDKEVLMDNIKYDLVKTKNSLFIIGGILFLSDLLSLSMANALSGSTIIYILIAPAFFVALGLLSKAKPMLSMSIAAFLFILIIALSIYTYGAKSLVSGLLVKAVLVYFFIKGFTHGKQAEKAKKDLALY